MDSIILKSFLPEIFLSFCILIQLVINARMINSLGCNYPLVHREIFTQTFFIFLCLLLLLLNNKIEGTFSNLLFSNNGSGNLIKIALVLICLFVLVFIIRSFLIQNLNFFEFFTMFLLSIFSLLLLLSACDFMSAYIIIEIQALIFYVMASFKRNSIFSTEAGLKYFVFGSFISCIFLFGCSILYGAVGTLNFNCLSLLLAFPLESNFFSIKYFILFGILFIFITFFFKISAAPFHFWSPDVYEGSPLSSTIIFSTVPKIAIFSFLIKCVSIFSLLTFEFQDLLIGLGLLSSFIGTFFAVRQKRLKRLIIYSSISQIGFLVAALSTNTIIGFSSIYFFIFFYIITAILIWGYTTQLYFSYRDVNFFKKDKLISIFISQLSGLFKLDKVASFSFLIIFFSIAGIPPLSGFISKLHVLVGLISVGFIFSCLSLVIINAVSAFYYLRIVKIVFFEINVFKSNNNVQTVFPNFLHDFCSCVFSICLFFLFFFYYNIEVPYLICNYLALIGLGA
jgi:NADH-quinone oxidoreductase subunit N